MADWKSKHNKTGPSHNLQLDSISSSARGLDIETPSSSESAQWPVTGPVAPVTLTVSPTTVSLAHRVQPLVRKMGKRAKPSLVSLQACPEWPSRATVGRRLECHRQVDRQLGRQRSVAPGPEAQSARNLRTVQQPSKAIDLTVCSLSCTKEKWHIVVQRKGKQSLCGNQSGSVL